MDKADGRPVSRRRLTSEAAAKRSALIWRQSAPAPVHRHHFSNGQPAASARAAAASAMFPPGCPQWSRADAPAKRPQGVESGHCSGRATPAIISTCQPIMLSSWSRSGWAGTATRLTPIQAVERHFGVALNYGDAPSWRTAGDVFASLLMAFAADQRDRGDLWPIFAAIMCGETGADASRVGADTLLLALPLRVVVGKWFDRTFGSRG
jgi:hypothetical protein